MRAVIQRVSRARVVVSTKIISEIGQGLLVLLGIEASDTEQDCIYMAEKIANLRIFDDLEGKMNLSVMDVSGKILLVSQFTICGDARHGRRPSFTTAMEPDQAKNLYEIFYKKLSQMGVPVKTGVFKEMMQVELINDGPVTILLDSKKNF